MKVVEKDDYRELSSKEASGMEKVEKMEKMENYGDEEHSGWEEPISLDGSGYEDEPVAGSGMQESSGETSEFISGSGDDTVLVEGERVNLFDLAKGNADIVMFQEAQTIHNNFASSKNPVKEVAPSDAETVIRARRAVSNTTEEQKNGSTTKRVAVTTAKPTTSVKADDDSTTNTTCKAHSTCFSDKECGEKGRCLGIFVGKCNCNACVNLLTCEDDGACGGLQGACNGTTSRCNCIEGYQANGYPKFIDALRTLCNVKECDRNSSDSCLGLPCNSGRCVC